MRNLSKIFQFVGFFGMLVGLGTTCTVLWYSTIIYFVGFAFFLLAAKYDSA